MARSTVVELVDDLDGSPATQAVRFAVDGQDYEIDLNDAHARDLRAVIGPFTAAGRRVGGAGRRASTHAVTTARAYDPQAVRTWAASLKIALPARGRIPTRVVGLYHAAEF